MYQGNTWRASALVALALVMPALSGVTAHAAFAADKLRVGKAQAQPFTFAPLDIGIEEGIFAKHNLDIEATAFPGSANLQRGIAADAIDIAVGSGPELAFIVKGNPELGVAAMANQPELLTIITQKDGPVKSVADLKGKLLSVSTVGSLTAWLVKELSRQQGWGPDGIKLVELGSDSPQVAALRTNQTNGMVTDIATALKLGEEGATRTIVHFGKIVPDFHIHVIFASNKIMADHPDQVREFLAGWFETIAYMKAHKADAVRIGARVGNVSEEIEGKVYDDIMPTFSTDGKFNPKALDTLAQSFVELGTLPTKPDLTKVITEKYLPGAPQ
ncbi:MAG TPA: ABC transporter substrate-binding protein [Stellaceae bacterium]|jgi:ABC-type nitrate/sulfonate/bicarbonate transport system substrate-binding protein|nr:ABC transporter substrate-binding protein [Stellaceae bacterium]